MITQAVSHTNQTRRVVFSPDGKRLATLSGEGLAIWSADEGQELLNLSVFDRSADFLADVGVLGGLAFSPNGDFLAIAAHGLVRILDATPVPPMLVPTPGSGQRQQIAEGWNFFLHPIDSASEGMDVGIDISAAHGGRKSAFVKSTSGDNRGTNGPAVRQIFRADDHRGKRIHLSAYLKTEQAKSTGYLVIRVDGTTRRFALTIRSPSG